MPKMQDVEQEVVFLRRQHLRTWRDKPIWYWVLRLLEEVAELVLSLAGLHKGPPRWELTQIAAICINFIEVLTERKEA